MRPTCRPWRLTKDEIKQILLNLVNNSSDALEGMDGDAKQISIRAYQNGPRVVIEVEETRAPVSAT